MHRNRIPVPGREHRDPLRSAPSGALRFPNSAPTAAQGFEITPAAGSQARGCLISNPTFFNLEAPPPDLRDLSRLCHPIWLRPSGHVSARSGLWSGPAVGARVASLRYPVLRCGQTQDTIPTQPDISRVNKTGHLDVLITGGNLWVYRKAKYRSLS